MVKKRQFYPLVLLALFLSACTTMPTIFQTDPVGASLVGLRNGYEAVITESGHAYKAGAITKPQLDQIVSVGKKFHDTYGLAVNAHLMKSPEAEKYRMLAAALLVQLTDLARSMYGYGGVK